MGYVRLCAKLLQLLPLHPSSPTPSIANAIFRGATGYIFSFHRVKQTVKGFLCLALRIVANGELYR